MIKKVIKFTVACDRCKKEINEDYYDSDNAEEHAIINDWLVIDKKHYCPDCYERDDNDDIVILSK